MSWKKNARKTAAFMMASVLLISGALMAEERLGYVEEETVSLNTPAILEKIPEMRISRADRTLLKELSQCAVVAELPDGGEIPVSENGEVSAALGDYLSGKEMESARVSLYGPKDNEILRLEWTEEEDRPFCLERRRIWNETHYYKVCGVKAFLSGGTIYENWDNTGAKETAVRRRWFAWIWEGPNRD